MKKLSILFAAMIAMVATSCFQADVEDINLGEEGIVTFTINAPGISSRAINDGTGATQLTYAIYDAEWKYLSQTTIDEAFASNLTEVISLRLVKNKTYNFVFWAQHPDATCYELSLGTTVGDEVAPTVEVKYGTAVANDETRDAFFGQLKGLKVDGTVNETVILTRPFAQINFATNHEDTRIAEAAGYKLVADVVTSFTTRAYTSLNLADGGVAGETDVTFDYVVNPSEPLVLLDKSNSYDWLAMNYILVPANESSLSTCSMTAKLDGQEDITIEYPMAPAKRNWRTNLVGNLLTEQAVIEVKIDPVPENEYVGVICVSTAAEFNAAFADPKVDFIVLSNDVVLTTPVSRSNSALLTVNAGNALKIDLNQHTLSASTGVLFDVQGELTVVNGVVENTAEGGKVFEDTTNVEASNTTIKTTGSTIFYDEEKVSYCLVSNWAEFEAALAANEAEIMLADNISYGSNYQLQKAVLIDLNGKAMELPMVNIHTATTVKNGTINGKVYARKNSEIVFDNVKFSGAVADNLSTEGHLAIQGGCKSLYAKNCLFSPTSVSGSQTKPLSFEGGASVLKFEGCEFKSSPYKKQVYLNSLGAAGSLEFINCNFNNKTPNIMFAATCPLTNITMSGTTKLSSVTFEINRAKDAVTEAEWAHIDALIANNSFSSVRVFYNATTSEYIR